MGLIPHFLLIGKALQIHRFNWIQYNLHFRVTCKRDQELYPWLAANSFGQLPQPRQ